MFFFTKVVTDMVMSGGVNNECMAGVGGGQAEISEESK